MTAALRADAEITDGFLSKETSSHLIQFLVFLEVPLEASSLRNASRGSYKTNHGRSEEPSCYTEQVSDFSACQWYQRPPDRALNRGLSGANQVPDLCEEPQSGIGLPNAAERARCPRWRTRTCPGDERPQAVRRVPHCSGAATRTRLKRQ